MRTFVTQDGRRYEVASSRELVRKLRRESRTQESPNIWRADTAYRASQSTGKTVRGDSDAHLVQDLISAGLLQEIKGNGH